MFNMKQEATSTLITTMGFSQLKKGAGQIEESSQRKASGVMKDLEKYILTVIDMRSSFCLSSKEKIKR